MSDHIIKKKDFYDNHPNFAKRTLIDYRISPGTMAKYDLIKKYLGSRKFSNAIDVGCSGNSILPFLDGIINRTYIDLAHLPMTQYAQFPKNHPSMGSITFLPFQSGTFDLVSALDVIEHVKNDQLAASELVRVLKTKGTLLLSVPHRMKYYSHQDVIIGHYRRYELNQLRDLFLPLGLKEVCVFGVYGQVMRFAQFSQGSNPEKMEEDLQNLRSRYQKNPIFHRIWDKFVLWGSKLMKMDARFQPQKKIMNICIIFSKK
ncbi:hypothetical protein NEF87_003986 [Candidatus Lokiarchaeum ossiferum]|uniref:Methyltransferase type 11 domain-containing protein n=1 Tax=Candidatus Lokiarchaeum ossiferum TaxID=2951803 RepID=A0ABY6HYQ0_9ARCH|nr:hypothetical protein NEF87_003986 [Candidatus Lokiarchaeum sp. B-35]